jgi:mannose-1-phosphate guanylyltransferase
MAGGKGTRFWPSSRQNFPKQFNDVFGIGQSLLQQTVSRFEKVCPPENVFIVTNTIYEAIVKEQLPFLTDDQILLEPVQKNTAPCIAYASFKIGKINPEASIIVTPADHAIFDETRFLQVVRKSLKESYKANKLVTIGLTPTRPETGYGYIQYLKDTDFLKKVKTFTEKPAEDLAKKFLDSGDFVWNAGIFIWDVAAIKEAFKKHLPDIYEAFDEIQGEFYKESEQQKISTTYPHCKSISIDYGIMEKAQNVYVALGDFGWSDIGSWNSLYEISDKDKNSNVVDANALVYDTTGTIVKGGKDRLIVLEGLKDYLVADYDNALIICHRTLESKFRQFVKDVKNKKGDEYL